MIWKRASASIIRETFGGYRTKRPPVALVYSAHFDSIVDAIAYERQVNGQERGLDRKRFRSSSRIVEKLSLKAQVRERIGRSLDAS